MNLAELRAPLAPNARLRYDVVSRLLRPIGYARTLLEIGCGQGALASILAIRYEYQAYEPDRQSFEVATERLRRLGTGRIINAPLPDEPTDTYDVVVAFEVLEHMKDDLETLSSWVRWIRPGGHIVLSVPAHPARFGPGDEYGGHYRRYTRDALMTVLRSAGLSDPRIAIYGFPLGYLLESTRNAVLARRLASSPSSPEERTAGSGRILQLDSRLAPVVWMATLPFRYLQRPFASTELGIGYVVRARRD